jgi:hypothetical protein
MSTGRVLIGDAEMDFVANQFSKVEGWCEPESAYFTICLLNQQMEMGCEAALLEIGVYKGKYLSVLYYKGKTSGQRVVGIDSFQWSSPEDVLSKFDQIFGSTEGLHLVSADSSRLSVPDVLEMMCGQKASFISVDGDHSAAGVRRDLQLVRGLLQEGGIIAVDDFLNPRAIGVSEGTYRFFLDSVEQQSLRPFAYCANKLYLADPNYHDRYVNAFWTLVKGAPDLPMIQTFNHWLKMGRSYVEQDLLGNKVLLI